MVVSSTCVAARRVMHSFIQGQKYKIIVWTGIICEPPPCRVMMMPQEHGGGDHRLPGVLLVLSKELLLVMSRTSPWWAWEARDGGAHHLHQAEDAASGFFCFQIIDSAPPSIILELEQHSSMLESLKNTILTRNYSRPLVFRQYGRKWKKIMKKIFELKFQ